MALALALGACGPLPRPFAHVDADPEALRPADGAGVMVDATRCPNGLGAAVIEALRDAEVLASAAGGNLGSLWLICEGGADSATLGWTLSDAQGATLGKFEQADAVLEALASDAAAQVLTLLGRDAVAPIETAPRPALVIAPIIGAPGNGRVALARTMAGALEWRGMALATEPGDNTLLILGTVVMSDVEPGVQRIEVVWEILKPDGQRLGVINQANTLPAGTLDGEWGAIAAAIADGGATGVLDLLEKSGL
ncbi:MAG: hypothetical protein VCB77_06950 [Alphaproteobacteria bacterium]